MLTLALLLLSPLDTAPLPPAPPQPDCRDAKPQPARDAAPPKLRTLRDEPLADQELAVQRSVHGCVVPMIVREDVGGVERR